jgi:catechol 2,3-dioxygenase-like lactoylglutathione lyase family enzyme
MGGPGAPDTLDEAHRTQVWLAISDDPTALVSGRYFYHVQLRQPNQIAEREDAQEALAKPVSVCLASRFRSDGPQVSHVNVNFAPSVHRRWSPEPTAPKDAPRPQRGQLWLAHIAFKVAGYAALRNAYAHLLKNGVEIQRAADHVCQRSIYFADPDGNGSGDLLWDAARAGAISDRS